MRRTNLLAIGVSCAVLIVNIDGKDLAERAKYRVRSLKKTGDPDLATDALIGDLDTMAYRLQGMMTMAMPAEYECNEKAKIPELKNCKDTDKTLEWYFEKVGWNACQMGLNLTDMEPGEIMTEPLGTLLATCIEDNAAAAVETPFCVERVSDGNYEGEVPVPPRFGGLKGGSNQYAWASDFNEDLGFGIVIHSTGSPGALTRAYSLPTFTVRDSNATVVYQGIYADPSTQGTDINVGLRSARVLDYDPITTILTVLAATVEVPNGKFVKFELKINDFLGTPIENVRPVDESPFVAPSVRALLQVSEEFVLYAPLFDVGGSTGNPFLKLLDLRTFQTLPMDLYITDANIEGGLTEASRLNGLVWDFECAIGGQCFINTISASDPDPLLTGDEDAIPLTSFFPFSTIETLVEAAASSPSSLGLTRFIPSVIIDPRFTVDYSAQSFEPIDKASALVCTLSGFLFRLGFAGGDILGQVFSGDNQGLGLLELGEGQECSICTTDLNIDETDEQRLLKKNKKNKGTNNVRSKNDKNKKGVQDMPLDDKQDGDQDDADQADDQVDDPTNTNDETQIGEDVLVTGDVNLQFADMSEATGRCEPVEIVNQPLTTAYVWAVEECGGKIFVGTYDISSVFGGLLGDLLVSQGASLACQDPNVVARVSQTLARPEDFAAAAFQVCQSVSASSATSFIDSSPAIRQSLDALLDSRLLGSPVTPADFGFDLYYIAKSDLSRKDPKLQPVTQNGFRYLSPTGPKDPFEEFFPLDFDPTTQADAAIRTMVCHKDPTTGAERLVIGSAVFAPETASNTYILDPDCSPER